MLARSSSPPVRGRRQLYFAYGSNMSMAVMRKHCATAQPVSVATLSDYRFVITADGYASIRRERGSTVQGVLWRVDAANIKALDDYESVATGLYARTTVRVTAGRRRLAALVYIGRPRPDGRPRPGYLGVVADAARRWQLPTAYVERLEAFAEDHRRD